MNHTISSNVFSGGSTPIAYEFTNGTGDTMIANNIFYNSHGESIFTLTRDTENLSDRTLNLSNNTFHGTHPLRPFVHYYTSLYGHTGSRINFSANTYLNLYKTTSSLVEFQAPGNSRTYTKNTITELDPSAQTFTHFANRVYASNGAYSGANMLNNP